MSRLPWSPTLALTALVLLAGCNNRFFRARGLITSDGGALGRWSESPQGCSRDDVSLQPTAGSTPVLSFAWVDPSLHDRLSPEQKLRRPNAPLWLAVRRGSTGVTASLRTIQTDTVSQLDRTNCGTLDVTTWEGKPALTGGRPTLDGTLKLDCRVEGSHVEAKVDFSGCEF